MSISIQRDEWLRRHRKMVAIDALNFKHQREQYDMTRVIRELNKVGWPAESHPVTVTNHGKETIVLWPMSMECLDTTQILSSLQSGKVQHIRVPRRICQTRKIFQCLDLLVTIIIWLDLLAILFDVAKDLMALKLFACMSFHLTRLRSKGVFLNICFGLFFEGLLWFPGRREHSCQSPPSYSYWELGLWGL